MPDHSTVLISMPEIAELARVRRPVVTMWRRRFEDSFPRPVSDDSSRPLFDAHAVLDWLARTGRVHGDTVAADLRQYALWQLGSQMQPTNLIAYATALICLRRLDDDEPLQCSGDWLRTLTDRARRVDPANTFLRSEVESLHHDAGWLVRAVDELVEAAWGCRSAFERLLTARTRLDIPALYRDAVTPELARLIAILSGASEHASIAGAAKVVDPYAGVGDLLTAVVAAMEEHGQPTISAATNTEYLARLLRRRLRTWDLPAGEVEVQSTKTLTDAKWDVLVTSLPYLAGETRIQEQELGYLRRLATKLGQDQCAVILASADLLSDQLSQAAAGTRNDLLRTDAVEAVITLPGGLMPFRPGYQTSLWVLRRDESGRGKGRTLLVDVSDRPLTAAVVDELVVDVITWRREGYHPMAHRRAFATPVRIADLVGGQPSLARPREPEVTEAEALRHYRVAQSLDLRTKLAEHEQRPRPGPIRTNVVARDSGARETATIGLLVKEKHIRWLKGARIATEHITGEGNHRVIGAVELCGRAPVGQRMIDRLVLSEHYPRVRLTEPDDVIVTATPSLAACVDTKGFSIAEYPAAVLRVNRRGRRLTPQILAALISATPSGVVRRIDRVQVPALEQDEVEAFDELLAALDERRRRAQEEIDILDTLRHIALAGTSDGTLTITPNFM